MKTTSKMTILVPAIALCVCCYGAGEKRGMNEGRAMRSSIEITGWLIDLGLRRDFSPQEGWCFENNLSGLANVNVKQCLGNNRYLCMVVDYADASVPEALLDVFIVESKRGFVDGERLKGGIFRYNGMASYRTVFGAKKTVREFVELEESKVKEYYAELTEKAKEADIAIIVNGEKLLKSQIKERMEKILVAHGGNAVNDSATRQATCNQIIQGFIVDRVLGKNARDAGLSVTDEELINREAALLKSVSGRPDAPRTIEDYYRRNPLGEVYAKREFEQGILIEKYISLEKKKMPKVNYSNRASEYINAVIASNECKRVSEKLALEKIWEIKSSLDKAPFCDVAKRFAETAIKVSECPSSKVGGDLGEFGRGRMVKEFEDVAFKLAVGKVSEPVRTKFGYHLILVSNRIGNEGASGQKVHASHILIKAPAMQKVPTKDEAVALFRAEDETRFIQDFVKRQIKQAAISASEEYKRLLPQ